MSGRSAWYPSPEDYERDIFGSQTCSLCGESLPANADYFVRREGGLTSRCRRCRNESSRRAYQARRGLVVPRDVTQPNAHGGPR
jgi:hypothetical protein